MKRVVLCGLMILGLSACAGMQPQTSPQTASADKPKCAPSMATGSHIVETSCDVNKGAKVMGASGFAQGMRQSNQSTGTGS